MSDVPVIAADLPCFECGYNLRSLRLDSNCPECGTSVEIASREGLSSFTTSGSIKRIRRGLALLLLAALAVAGSAYLGRGREGWIFALLSFSPSTPRLWLLPPVLWEILSTERFTLKVLWVTGQATYFAGIFQVAWPEAAGKNCLRFSSLRKRLLIGAVAAFAALVASLVVAGADYTSGDGRYPFKWLAALFILDAALALFLHDLLAYLVRRIPAASLAAHLRIAKFGSAAGSIAMAGFMLFRAWMPNADLSKFLIFGIIPLAAAGGIYAFVTIARTWIILRRVVIAAAATDVSSKAEQLEPIAVASELQVNSPT